MKIVMTGGNGRIGKYMQEWGVEPLAGDITNPSDIDDRVSWAKPDIILHLAAISDIDYCENPANEKEVIGVNLKGTYNLLTVAEKYKAEVVMLSSDHVFSGKRSLANVWGYNEDAKPNPINFYGQSKLAAEGWQQAFSNFKIVRTSYLFDAERLKGKEEFSQPTFIRRSFMYLPHFASHLFHYLQNYSIMPKILHLSGSKVVSWHKFMSAIYPNIESRSREMYDVSPRPYYAGLRTKYKFFLPLSYLDGIKEMLK